MTERRKTLERRYRRLLAWYPRSHRELHGEEMLGVLLAGAGDKRWPGLGESADLLWGAARVRWRHTLADGGRSWADALAIVSVLAPVLVLAGAASGLHELAWFIRADGLVHWWTRMPWLDAFADAPVWLLWLAVAVLAVRGAQRTAAIGAWMATIALAVATGLDPGGHWWLAKAAVWVLLGLVAAVALTGSPAPRRGLELLGWGRLSLVAGSVVASWAVETAGYHLPYAVPLALAALIVGVLAAVRLRTRSGRRAALILVLPIITTGLASPMVFSTMVFSMPIPLALATFYAAPLALFLVLSRLLRRLERGAD